ncbi:helix-turn-helix transcriptional regulator [Trinickia soli]|uniref:helix-turn-helix transcriptional regulator n=1 Tax=Trinickia soli TaxID=380675 RepID=UPI001252BDDF|nr:hypothetical protein CIW54_03890 [Paraburkholderia sp. T12-10]
MQANLDKVLTTINSLSDCTCDPELHLRLRCIFSELQIPSFVFSTFNLDTSGLVSGYRFLIGCSPEWIQIYQHRHWYSNDPYLQYARLNTSPAAGSTIPVASAGQREMRDTAHQYGFHSNFIVPAHSRTTSLIGVLHVANDTAKEDGGEARLLQWRGFLRAIAATLLDVRVLAQHQLMVRRFELQERELAALRFVLVGEAAHEIARNLGLSVASIYSMYSRINGKLGTSRINEAARLAQRYELL